MNVLVYADVQSPEIHQTITTLKRILVPHYTVQPISTDSLLTQPWQPSCALFVLTASPTRHQEATSLTGNAAGVVEKYVESGGSVLGLGYDVGKSGSAPGFGSDLSMLRDGKQFRLHDKKSGNTVYPRSFSPSTETPSTHVHILESGTTLALPVHSSSPQPNSESEFESEVTNLENMSNLTVLARFEPSNAIAGLQMSIGSGKAAFWAERVDLPSTITSPDAAFVSSVPSNGSQAQEQIRPLLPALTHALQSLGILVPASDVHPSNASKPATITSKPTLSHPLPQFLFSRPKEPEIVQDFIRALFPASHSTTGKSPQVLEDTDDTFYFHMAEKGEKIWLMFTSAPLRTKTADTTAKHIILSLPPSSYTPLFDSSVFFEALQDARVEVNALDDNTPDNGWSLGDLLLYGPLVTSTQTMFDKNPRFLSGHPVPLLSIASYQLQGRGRGKNEWVSPGGCLMMSFSLRAALGPQFGANRLVFVQYLAALAVVEGVRAVFKALGSGTSSTASSARLSSGLADKVKIKWPNDIYVELDTEKGVERKKIGGVLVNSSFGGGKVDIVVGIGLNVLSLPPLASIAQLLPPDLRPDKVVEHTAASIIATFDVMWTDFLNNGGSFDPFMELYLKRWMHS
ncbi:hypothetical protein SERLA73DRAFT_50233 [Serpula lacrymans var. lacrymans S7.3]|uniref:BPL/LPL catalytic domain-containing protein n=1 Tax=Serpula lacrymans var. lacrymans (strain S7.3) TaxID=936435 RepID=F8PTQ4_SERL3|nr:hypothetical protein SERLA73DRAFT_50233 [Serpula lacrymans var. lacrymans S7.3]